MAVVGKLPLSLSGTGCWLPRWMVLLKLASAVLLCISAPWFHMAPPKALPYIEFTPAELLAIVEPLIVTWPVLKMPPPYEYMKAFTPDV